VVRADGELITLEMKPVVEIHILCAFEMANSCAI
jgi:hypothetical protein